MEALGIGVILLIGFGVFLFFLLLPLFAVIDIVKSEFKNHNDKLIWILVVLFFPIVGSFLYFIIGRGQK